MNEIPGMGGGQDFRFGETVSRLRDPFLLPQLTDKGHDLCSYCSLLLEQRCGSREIRSRGTEVKSRKSERTETGVRSVRV